VLVDGEKESQIEQDLCVEPGITMSDALYLI
jgi:hypothetical protein